MENFLKCSTKTKRGAEFLDFALKVIDHIDNYTVPQYGDLDLENSENGDQMQNASLEDIQMNLKRYVNRMNSNSRGIVEARRDLVKIAHYAAILNGKYDRNEIENNNKIIYQKKINQKNELSSNELFEIIDIISDFQSDNGEFILTLTKK